MAKEQNQNYLRYFLPMAVRAKKDDNKHEFTISDSTLDRYGTIIPVSSWNLDNYNKNGIVAYQHETNSWSRNDPDYILGPGKAWVDDDTLVGEVTYEPKDLNPLADKIRRKVDFGTLKATSVGFMPIRGHYGNEENGENPKVYYFDEVDLLEFSIVNIPANPNAVKRSIDQFLSTQNPQNLESDGRDIIVPSTDDNKTFLNPGEGHPNDRLDRESGIVPFEVLKARSWLTLHQLKNR